MAIVVASVPCACCAAIVPNAISMVASTART
jgi:hypothetical protein